MVFRRSIFLILMLPSLLFGALTFGTNYDREVQIVRAFDLPGSYVNDPYLQKVITKKRKEYRHHRRFFKNLEEAYLFIPTIREIMSESEIPSEFLFLAMVESGLTLDARSHKKAGGLWQFLPSTGRLFGLQIDDYVDERRDLIKSTKAAVRYLEALHARFGKWYLAALAYNCGESRLADAIRRAGTDDVKILLNSPKHYIPWESRDYLRKILALTFLGADEAFIINQEYAYMLNRANAYSIAPVAVARGERLSRVAKLLDIPLYKLTSINRQLNYDFVPPNTSSYRIYIPSVKLKAFQENYKPAPLESFYVLHKVKAGDNLAKIGQKYRVPYKMIKEFNHLADSRLRIGQKLVIPMRSHVALNRGKYTVKEGDSLAKIAKDFETTIAHIKKINNLDSGRIHVGDRLSVYD